MREFRNTPRSKDNEESGLSGSGKTTLANRLEEELNRRGYQTYSLDGDNIRSGVNKDLDFSSEDRSENIRRIAEVANLFKDAGVVTLSAFITPMEKDRDQVRKIVGSDDLIEVFVDASLSACEERDPKGLYKLARAGKIDQFTGITSPYEAPVNPALHIQTETNSIDQCVIELLEFIEPKLLLNE